MDMMKTSGIMMGKSDWRLAEASFDGGNVRVLNLKKIKPAEVTNGNGEDGTMVVASLPWADVLTRYWEFPGVEEEMLLGLVNHQFEADVPVAIEELTWGFRKNHANVLGKTGWRVFVQAVRTKRVLECRNEVFNGGRMVHGILTTPMQAIGAFYRYGIQGGAKDGNDILILATAEEWQIVFLIDGLVRNVRRIRGAGEAADSLMMQCSNLLDEENFGEPSGRILWCADENVKATIGQVGEILGRQIVQVECDGRLIDSQGERFVCVDPASYAVAIGSALGGLFDRDEMVRLAGEIETKEPESLTRFKKILSHTRRWSALAAGLMIFAITIHLYGLSHENTIMEELIDQAASGRGKIVSMESKIDSAKRLRLYRIDVEGILVDVCRAVPDSVVISAIQLSREHRLTIRGTAKDPKAIFTFVDTLRKSKRLTNINPEAIEPNKGGFTLTAEMIGTRKMNSRDTRGETWN
jgi:hypothetical protein